MLRGRRAAVGPGNSPGMSSKTLPIKPRGVLVTLAAIVVAYLVILAFAYFSQARRPYADYRIEPEAVLFDPLGE